MKRTISQRQFVPPTLNPLEGPQHGAKHFESPSLPRKTFRYQQPDDDDEAPAPSRTPSVMFYASQSTLASSSMGSVPDLEKASPISYLSATDFCRIVLDYLDDCMYRVRAISFQHLAQTLQSAPSALLYCQMLLTDKLAALPWHLVGNCIDHILSFIRDPDLREANMEELAEFLRSLCAQPPLWKFPNILSNLSCFFQEALCRFKHYLTNLWLYTDRIASACEFGRRSDTLFLCMECHREHR